MNLPNFIKINKSQITRAKKAIPPRDFTGADYDRALGLKTDNLLLILSTPRSGSTFLSDQIYRHGICLPHEYFQPFQYIPILADRWGCIINDMLDNEDYIFSLKKWRTSSAGWLGINLHGEHLPIFKNFEKNFLNIKKSYIVLKRRDLIAQSVSFEIAMQTERWSSHFKDSNEPIYSFHEIKSRLEAIVYQNIMIDAYINNLGIVANEIYYEDLIKNPIGELAAIFPDFFNCNSEVISGLAKQSSGINNDWVERFSNEYFDTVGSGFEKPLPKFQKDLRRAVRKINNLMTQ